ncbi:MAG: sigma-54-dependent Fis family transcriptional regulator [Candidatus Abyssobacteria bacterium SURF_17]|uniref:Sigma-54-dependent Fis family transcriptional regulator n=1 Tax=Candidatus Abyssobacteria bacterium SURF_17 TaxID=2093361 RepID=A0A419EWR7_9BACT|nr:MAG: sigma-54-dependent Fis family transcriptional regulator [Candidatus Abyssubacteria bacterium SURF_17]
MKPEPITVLIVDDEEPFRTGLCARLKRKGFRTFGAATGEEALAIAREHLLDVALVDIRMPGMNGIELLSKLKETHPSIEVIILTGAASVETALEAMKLGAYDYLSKPCKFEELRMLVERAYEKKRLRHEKLILEKELKRLTCTGELVGASAKAAEIRKFISQAAQADCAVLLEGESGVGKELVAREIHRQSARADAPFVVLDCGAFPETLLANELFGHEKGAFTTALDSRQGLLEIANGGTLLIDEVGELTPANQVALLRVAETNKFRRLGGSKELHVNIRIIASTNRNLRDAVAEGRFRKDLFYRLEILHFTVPTLRERKEDIPLLAEHFLACLNRARGTNKKLKPEQKELLKSHPWPGNVRELANIIERSFYLSSDDKIQPAIFIQLEVDVPNLDRPVTPTTQTLSDLEREHILRMLAAKKGNKKETAKALGISRSRLYKMLKKHNIAPPPES